MTIKLQELTIPNNCKIVKNEFTTYNPETDYSEDNSFNYLIDDLLQIEVIGTKTIIDLGWYGDCETNNGKFKIYVVKNRDWENPLEIEESTSQKTIANKLNEIIRKYTDSK